MILQNRVPAHGAILENRATVDRGDAGVAYNEDLANHIRAILADRPHMVAKKMFGGIGFILNGNMAVGVLGDELMVRVPPEQYEALQREPHIGIFDLTGRPMRGWLVVAPAGFATDAALEQWVAIGVAVAESLPPK